MAPKRKKRLVSGNVGKYPANFEAYRRTNEGLNIFLRPVKITDEELLKTFFFSVSNDSMYHRFASARTDMPHERLQDFTLIDYGTEMVILAVEEDKDAGEEKIIGIGQYTLVEDTHSAEVAFLVRDDYQHKGVGRELLRHLTHIAKERGILGFRAEVLTDNPHMMKLFEEAGFDLEKRVEGDMFDYKMIFRREE
jgi:RimJ/RimL family protein N-acetyltransferase